MSERASVAPQQATKTSAVASQVAATERPLEDATREYLEPRLGFDLRHVRACPNDGAPPNPPSVPLIQRRCACEGSDESCAKCAVQRRALPVSMPGDALEVDADRAASRAMCFLGGDVTAHATEPIVQRASAAPGSGGGHAESTAVLAQIGSGRALDGPTRSRMEGAFGSSFENVRVHDDPGAAMMARKFDAHAFTLGQHIAFASGAYRPGTRAGDDLLAHELAHTIQQRGAAPLLSRKNTGGCAELAETVDEQKDENSKAGMVAHKQIQMGLPDPPPPRSGFDLRHVAVTAPPSDEVPSPVHDVLGRPGMPLDHRTRAFFEPRLGAVLPVQRLPAPARMLAPRSLRLGAGDHPLERDADRLAADALHASPEPERRYDLSHVRVHVDGAADASARAVDALAFSAGTHIVFRGGHYAPDTGEGRQLLAHELAHTMQSGAAEVVRRQNPSPSSDPTAGKKPFTIIIPVGITNKLEFYRYAETVIFGGVRNVNWIPSGTSENTLAELGKHAGEKMTFWVWPSQLAQGGPAPTATDTAAADKAYWNLTTGDRDALNTEIDRRYYESTGDASGTKIGAGDAGKKAIWNSIRMQVVADKKKLDALPEAIKQFVGGEANITPDKYPILIRIVTKLSTLSASDLEDYKKKVTATTMDLAVLEASLDQYLKDKAEREKARTEREAIVTKLFGSEDVYQQYKEFKAKMGKPAELERRASDEVVQGSGDKAHETRAEAKKWREEILPAMYRALVDNLKKLGFNSVAEFEQYIRDYEAAFIKETVAIARDLLRQFEHKLYEGEKRYSSNFEVEGMLYALEMTGAPMHLAAAKDAAVEASRLRDRASLSTVQGSGDIANQLSSASAKKTEEAKTEWHEATQASQKFRASYGDPLMLDPKFPLAAITPYATLNPNASAAKPILLGYIKDRREDIEKVSDALQDDPHVVYKLDGLMALSYERQGVIKGSIFDTIISEYRQRYVGEEAIQKVALAVIGIILTVLTFGGGLVGGLAAVGAAGISTYSAIKEFEEYEVGHASANLGLISKDPSFAWVIVAAVGAVADIGVAFSAVKAIKLSGAVEAFKASGDVAQFEKDLKAIKDLNAAVYDNVRKAAQLEAESAAAMKAAMGTATSLGSTFGNIVASIPEFSRLAYLAVKRGIVAFRVWVAELEAAKIIANAKNLKPEELKALKEAWDQGQKYAQAIKQTVPQLEKAIGEFRATTGVKRAVSAEGVEGGTAAAARVEIEGLGTAPMAQGSTKAKGAQIKEFPNNPRYGSPSPYGGSKNHAEQNLLGDLADKLDAAKGIAKAKGVPKTEVNGTVYLHVEQKVCNTCRQGLNTNVDLGVIGQFSAEYPNVTLVITNAETAETMFVRGGKAILM